MEKVLDPPPYPPISSSKRSFSRHKWKHKWKFELMNIASWGSATQSRLDGAQPRADLRECRQEPKKSH